MANIGEALTTRLARERLAAIKKFLPVRDSVREKLQARQEAKVEFAEGAEELFKPVTAATTEVKTAITGKIDPVDPTKSVPGLLQAIEELKKEQTVADAGADAGAAGVKGTFINKFTEEGIEEIKSRPLENEKEYRDFAAWIILNYNERQKYLKPGAGKGISQDEWRDYVYKVNRDIPRINKTDITYIAIKGYVSDIITGLRTQQEKDEQAKIQQKQQKQRMKEDAEQKRQEEKQQKKQSVASKLRTPQQTVIDVDPGEYEYALEKRPRKKPPQRPTTPTPPEEEEDDFPTPVSTPPDISEERETLKEQMKKLQDELKKLIDEREKLKKEIMKKGTRSKVEKIEKDARSITDEIAKVSAKLKKTGKGYTGRGYNNHICPDNIINDVSRLEVLIGGRRAGNNSPEIINEAADICQRLFQRGIMDIGVYRGLIDELADGYHSD